MKNNTVAPTEKTKKTGTTIGIIAICVVIVPVFTVIITFLLMDSTPTVRIRDIMIILTAGQAILIGITLIILGLQTAKLINLVKNEVKPVLESAQDTLFTIQGTATYISDSVIQPVSKLNSYLQTIRTFIDLIIKR